MNIKSILLTGLMVILTAVQAEAAIVLVCNPDGSINNYYPGGISTGQFYADPGENTTLLPNVLLNPVVPAGSRNFWRCVDTGVDGLFDAVEEWSQAEKDAYSAAQTIAMEQAIKDNAEAQIDTDRAIRGLALVIMDELNILRAEHGLADRTKAQIMPAIKLKITNGEAN